MKKTMGRAMYGIHLQYTLPGFLLLLFLFLVSFYVEDAELLALQNSLNRQEGFLTLAMYGYLIGYFCSFVRKSRRFSFVYAMPGSRRAWFESQWKLGSGYLLLAYVFLAGLSALQFAEEGVPLPELLLPFFGRALLLLAAYALLETGIAVCGGEPVGIVLVWGIVFLLKQGISLVDQFLITYFGWRQMDLLSAFENGVTAYKSFYSCTSETLLRLAEENHRFSPVSYARYLGFFGALTAGLLLLIVVLFFLSRRIYERKEWAGSRKILSIGEKRMILLTGYAVLLGLGIRLALVAEPWLPGGSVSFAKGQLAGEEQIKKSDNPELALQYQEYQTYGDELLERYMTAYLREGFWELQQVYTEELYHFRTTVAGSLPARPAAGFLVFFAGTVTGGLFIGVWRHTHRKEVRELKGGA